MKRLLVILIMLGLILTGCASIKETAKGEESPEEVITQQQTKEPVPHEDTEPPKPEEETSKDGWDVSVSGKSWNDKTPLDENEIPERCRGKIVDWIRTDFALVILCSDNYIGYIVDGELVSVWDTEVNADNFLFDASLFNEHAEYRWYAYVGTSIVSIRDEVIEYETRELAQFEFTGIDWYSYYILAGNLYFWSPSCTSLVAGGVAETYTKNGYTFYRSVDNEIYVLDANPFTIGRQTQEYVNAHPLTPIHLGKGPMHDYYVQLNPREGGSNPLNACKEFEERYGLNTLIYGNPTDTIDVKEFIEYATESRHHIFDHYNIPTENTEEMFKFDNIYLHGHLGHLRVFYKNGAIDYLSWTCYEHSAEIYDDLRDYFLTYGPAGEARAPRDGQIEESAVVDGYNVFAGYEDSDHGQYTYAFILYQ